MVGVGYGVPPSCAPVSRGLSPSWFTPKISTSPPPLMSPVA